MRGPAPRIQKYCHEMALRAHETYKAPGWDSESLPRLRQGNPARWIQRGLYSLAKRRRNRCLHAERGNVVQREVASAARYIEQGQETGPRVSGLGGCAVTAALNGAVDSPWEIRSDLAKIRGSVVRILHGLWCPLGVHFYSARDRLERTGQTEKKSRRRLSNNLHLLDIHAKWKIW